MTNYTPAELAEILKTTERQVYDWRKQHGWPCIKIGRTIRFASEHVEAILAKHTVAERAEAKAAAILIEGQTKGSARRAS